MPILHDFSIWSLFNLWINILYLYKFHIFEINANIFIAGFFGNGMLSDKKMSISFFNIEFRTFRFYLKQNYLLVF